jgi:hypothetical protein
MRTLPLFAAPLLCLAPSTLAVNLIADYQLTDTFASAVAGAPPLTPLGSVSFTSGNVYGQNRILAAFQQGSGLRLDAPPGLAAGGYTVALEFSFASTGGYRKIIDFKDLTLDSGLYNLNHALDFYPVALGPGSPIQPNTFGQVVLTRTAAGAVTGYFNGAQLFAFSDASALSVLLSNSFNLFIDDTRTNGAEASAGMVARVRLWDGALTPQQVAALDGNPPPPCGSADFDCDGDVATDADIESFFRCLAGACPPPPCTSSADFNSDGDSATDADIEAFFRVLAGGSC